MSTAAPTNNSSGGSRLATVLKSSGPVVTCVLLQHLRKTGRDVHPHPAIKPPPDGHVREVLPELIQEVQVDTTPSQNGVRQVLGGPFTFIGQYPDEGVILMARSDQFADLSEIDKLSVKELRNLCQGDPKLLLEKADLVDDVRNSQLPINPHKLQPPLDDQVVRGDILIMRVGGEEQDEEGDNNKEKEDNNPEAAISKAIANFQSASAVPNEEFFLNYTKEEYVAFASRTDVVAPEIEAPDDDEEEEDGEEEDKKEDDDEEEDDEFEPGEEVESEDEKFALLNSILGEVMRKFREEQGRGPSSEELLDMRRQVADKLNLELDEVPADGEDKKRAPEIGLSPSTKRVKFTPEVADGFGPDDDSKPAAENDETKQPPS